jgi:hypothetical protein
METDNRFYRFVVLLLILILILSCTLAGSPEGEGPDPSAVETDIALRVLATSLAKDQLTLQAVQAQMTQQGVPVVPPTQAPTQIVPPSPTLIPTQTAEQASVSLVVGIQTSVSTFYCYQPPYELTITVRVSDINRGMAVYYHIEDKVTGVESDNQVIDLHRRSSDTRGATIIGGFGEDQNLQFPPLMGESYFIFQIISDDGNYRSPVYSDITFFPCAQ